MGLEMVRIGSKQNIYIELNEVGVKRISVRPYKVERSCGIIWIKYKTIQKTIYICW